MDARVSVTRLMADVRQRLLAALMDIEQRWQLLTPEDRVDALTDLIALSLIYNRAFSDEATTTETLAQSVGKALSDQSYPVDQAALATGLQADDVFSVGDTYARAVDYARSPEDFVEMADVIETLLTIIRGYTDTAALSDAAAKTPEKVFADLGGLYVEAGYFADDYWQADGVTPGDAFALTAIKSAAETLTLADLLAYAMEYARTYADSALLADATSLEPQLTHTESLTATDDATKALSPVYEETLTSADAAALDFATQIQELVAAAEDFAKTVDFARSVTETASATDAPTKTFTTAFSDIGGLYAAVGYFADDYVQVGTGPAVYDTFTFTLT